MDALIDDNRNSRKWGFHELQLHSKCSGDVVEVGVEGGDEKVQRTILLLQRLTSSYEVLPVKESWQSVLTVGFLEKMRRMTKAAIGLKAGAFFIFGLESERLEAKFVIRQELNLWSSSSWEVELFEKEFRDANRVKHHSFCAHKSGYLLLIQG